MPRGDRTGPDGLGPMSGRKLGYCAGYKSPGFTKPVTGAGMAHRHGSKRRGNCRKNRNRVAYIPIEDEKNIGYFAKGYRSEFNREQPTRDEEINYLEDTAEQLKVRLDKVMDRIDQLKKEKDKNDEN